MRERSRGRVWHLLEGRGDRGCYRGRDGSHVVEVYAGLRLGGGGPQERGAQIVGGDTGEEIGGQLDEALVGAGHAGVGPPGVVGEVLEGDRHVLERLALDQAGDQAVALRPQRKLLVELETVRSEERRGGKECVS